MELESELLLEQQRNLQFKRINATHVILLNSTNDTETEIWDDEEPMEALSKEFK